MALLEEFDKSGNVLFRYRSYIPVAMYVLAVLVLWLDPQNFINPDNLTASYLCFGFSVIGMIVRFIVIGYVPKATSGRNTSEGQVAETVNNKGIYSLVRHPLYLGNFFMWLGIFAYVGNVWFIIVSCLLYWVYYERIMFAEEFFMRTKFGTQYTDWAAKVPAFWPKLSGWIDPEMDFSVKNILKREYSGFLATVISFLFVNVLKHYFQTGEFGYSVEWVYATIAAIVITVVLKTMKKAKLLEVSGR
ncbi:MAG: isoprenylcysteine carboxylmethyltransferase family protein [Bacteroidota bacterium]